jgi:alpha-D-ribose 1-methylphosphonate 5-triphosphate synthase subunit PhnG
VQSFTQTEYLTILTHSPAENVKSLADEIIQHLGKIVVMQNRTGLVMLPFSDSAKGSQFHLGEVLVAEAHVRLENGNEGYAACVGRDLLQALAIALLDTAVQSNIQRETIFAFISEQQSIQQGEDDLLLRQVESTRIEMETF